MALLITAALACGGDGGSSMEPPVPVETVTVTPNPVDLAIGQTVQLTVTLRDADGNVLTGRTVTWSSETTSIATVDGSGLVTGVEEGSATIAAVSENKVGRTITRVVPTDDGAELVRAVAGPGGKEQSRFVTVYQDAGPSEEEWEDIEMELPGIMSPSGLGFFFGLGPGFLRDASPAASRTDAPSGNSADAARALFVGGIGGGSVVATRSALLFDPKSRATVSLEMTAARVGHTLAPLSSTRVLITGGDSGTIGAPGSIKTLSSAEIFDVTTSLFTPTGSMAEARARHASAPLPGGRVLVVGGLVPTGGAGGTIDVASAEVFDPATGAFTPTGPMSVTRFNHSAIALDDGRVLVLGGNGRKSAEVYDPTSGTFSALPDMAVNHGLGHRAVKLLNGKVLVLGGDGGVIQPTAAAELFDPGTNQFTMIADMTTTRMLHLAVLISGGRVLIAGGQDATGEVLASAEIYDPVSNTFTAAADMPLPGSEQAAVGILP